MAFKSILYLTGVSPLMCCFVSTLGKGRINVDELISGRQFYNAPIPIDEFKMYDQRLFTFELITILLSILLLGSICFIIINFITSRKIHKELLDSVVEKHNTVTELKEVTTKLNEVNAQKLALVAYALKLTTQYINAFENYRGKLLKKCKVKYIDDFSELINDSELLKEQYEGFYEDFDKTVLSIFPSFIEEYNDNVEKENSFSAETVAKTNTLNTKLRIYALRRLGISKSSEIAEMLNVSIRTVCNNKIGLTTEEKISIGSEKD